MSEAILIFNGYRHNVDKVLGKASIPIEVAYKDINDDLKLVGLENVGDPSKYYDGTTVFIKFEGKFVPLLGRTKVMTNTVNPDRVIKGMLITSVALKAARIDDGIVRPTGPVTLKTPSEDVRVKQSESAPLKNFDGLRDKFNSTHRASAPRQSNQNYGGSSRPESVTGNSLRSRSPYRRP